MDKDSAIRTLKAHEAELRALGGQRLSLFGSLARGEAGPESDVDLAVTLDPDAKIGLFRYVALRDELAGMLGRDVDMVREPVTQPRLQARIDRDRVGIF